MIFVPKGELRRGISAAAAAAVVCVVAVAGGVAYFYPSLTGNGGGTNSTSATTGNPRANGTSTSQSSTVYSLPPVITTSTTSTSGGQGWQAWAVANITLGYSKTQSYINRAWNYSFSIYQTSSPSYEVLLADVIHSYQLTVTGNWTAGYVLTSYPAVLNVSVQYKAPADYTVIFFNARNMSAASFPIRYNSTQQRAISAALANSTVKGDLSQFPYFVDAAFAFPSANKTFGGDYLVSFDQSNGPKVLNAFVNMTSGAVVSTYAESRAVKTCYPNGACWSSPWGSP